ncbi:glutamate ligase domain-containing protein, partial [Klebsiella pneumoniae]|uniref:glutamate ligase domain-containing protein n=1 Tax=Klebsiella pneumoniae TaxID=573 RepID=UPI003EE41478
GLFNVQNTSAALALVLSQGYTLKESVQALSSVPPVPGRFEAVPNERGIPVIVDYAHTPDALAKLLTSVRPLTKGKITTVFGCGG